MTPRILLPLCLALLFWGCQPKEPLPRATQFGANTFGCKINGKTYIPDGGGSFSGIKPINGGISVISANPLIRGIYIRTYRSSKESLSFFINNYKTGSYELNANTSPSPLNFESFGLYQIASGQVYMTSSINTGRVTITKADTITGIVSGSFSFKAGAVDLNGNPNGTGTVEVTEGRFDTKTF